MLRLFHPKATVSIFVVTGSPYYDYIPNNPQQSSISERSKIEGTAIAVFPHARLYSKVDRPKWFLKRRSSWLNFDRKVRNRRSIPMEPSLSSTTKWATS